LIHNKRKIQKVPSLTKINNLVHKSILFLIFFIYQIQIFEVWGCQNILSKVIISRLFFGVFMKIIKEMKEVLIASGILFTILMGILVFTQVYF